MHEIRKGFEHSIESHKINVVVIDYLQLINHIPEEETKERVIADMSRSFKQLATVKISLKNIRKKDKTEIQNMLYLFPGKGQWENSESYFYAKKITGE